MTTHVEVTPFWFVLGLDVRKCVAVIVSAGRSRQEAMHDVLNRIDSKEVKKLGAVDFYEVFCLTEPGCGLALCSWLLKCGIGKTDATRLINNIGEALMGIWEPEKRNEGRIVKTRQKKRGGRLK